MIIWITGQMGSGKSALAHELCKRISHCVKLDGDQMRLVWSDLGFSKNDRFENNARIARLAQIIDHQGWNVIISVIAPYKLLRDQIRVKLPDVKFVYVDKKNVTIDEDHPYEIPQNPDVTVYPDNETIEVEAKKVMGQLRIA